jgi:hypothetical protein
MDPAHFISYAHRKTRCNVCSKEILKGYSHLYAKIPLTAKSSSRICRSCLNDIVYHFNKVTRRTYFEIAKSNRRTCGCCETHIPKDELHFREVVSLAGLTVNLCFGCLNEINTRLIATPEFAQSLLKAIPKTQEERLIDRINKLKALGDYAGIGKLLKTVSKEIEHENS